MAAQDERRQARFLAALLLVLPLVSAVGIVVQVVLAPDLLAAALWEAPFVALAFVGYGLARSRWWRGAVWLVIGLVAATTIVAVVARPDNPVLFSYLVIPVFLASAFLDRTTMGIVTLGMVAVAVPLLVHARPAMGTSGTAAAAVGLLVLLSVAGLTSLHRFALEADRRRDLAEREALARRLLEASFGGLVVVRDGRIHEVNRGFARLFGAAPEDLVGQTLQTYLPDSATDTILDLDGPQELAGRRADGSFVPVAVVARPSSNPDVDDQVVAVQDLTDREAVRARLHQADRMAAMGQLAAGVAHEINNPLTWIIGNLERVIGGLGGDSRQLVEQAIDGAKRVRRIARDLNTFAREREGPLVGMDLARVARSSVNMVRHDLEHHGTLEEAYHEAPTVDADPTRVGQVCLNLLVNAAQAVSNGGGTTVRVEVGTDEEGNARFEVRDDGPGIPPSLRPRVFEPFFSTKVDGTGLGLAISRSLIEEMGGGMYLGESADGGTQIGFWLPPGSLGAEPDDDTGEEEAPAPRRARILVIDDEPAICELIQAGLSEHDVEVATSGEEGLRRVLAEDYDLVLCDLMMPGVTGMQVHAALKEAGAGREERLVFLTGGAFTAEAQAFLDALGNPVLHKPFRLSRVREKVADLLRAVDGEPGA